MGVRGEECSVAVDVEDALDTERTDVGEGGGLAAVGRVMEEEGREKMLRPLWEGPESEVGFGVEARLRSALISRSWRDAMGM